MRLSVESAARHVREGDDYPGAAPLSETALPICSAVDLISFYGTTGLLKSR